MALKRNFYYIGREWPYKNIKPRIIVEPYLEDPLDGELRDYKFFCFNGVAKLMFIASERGDNLSVDYFDMDFNHMKIRTDYPNSKKTIHKPENFEIMIQLSEKLSEGYSHVRVDWYEIGGKLYFGEMTLYHHSGFGHFYPQKWDIILGGMAFITKKLI